jgi:hypothetical protein
MVFDAKATQVDCGSRYVMKPVHVLVDCLCGLEFLATDPEVRVRFPALPEFLRSSDSEMGSTQPREYN